MMKNMLEDMKTVRASLPTKQRRLCDFILEHGKSVYLMPVGDLASASGVGRATVMRFVETMGYTNYPDFKRALNASYFTAFETIISKIHGTKLLFRRLNRITVE